VWGEHGLVTDSCFAITLPKAPDSIDADMMSMSQIREQLDKGLSEATLEV